MIQRLLFSVKILKSFPYSSCTFIELFTGIL